MTPLPPIHLWPVQYRRLVQVFLGVVFFGYGVGFVNLFLTQQTSPKGIATHWRGLSEEELETAEEIVLPKPVKELIITTHNHLLGLAAIFGIVGFLFLHTGYGSPRMRLVVAVDPLLSLVLTFGGIWLTRFFGEAFAFLVLMGGMLTHPVFLFSLLAVFLETFKKNPS